MPIEINYYKFITVFTSAYFLAYISIPLLIALIHRWNILDKPDRRKIHKISTPAFGGIAFLFGSAFSVLLWEYELFFNISIGVVMALFLMLFVGVRDDVSPLKPISKLFAQLIAAFLIIGEFSINVNQILDVTLISSYGLYLNTFITLVFIIAITNCINLIDGCDGLAGGLLIISFGSLSLFYFFQSLYIPTLICLSLTGSLLAFLKFNFEPAKIFMGDTGALLAGLILAIFFIHLINGNWNRITFSFVTFRPISFTLSLIYVPILDLIRVSIIRLSQKRSPFDGDKLHIHHLFLRSGFSHRQTSLILIGFQMLIILVSLIPLGISDLLMFFILLIIGIVSYLLFIKRWKRNNMLKTL